MPRQQAASWVSTNGSNAEVNINWWEMFGPETRDVTWESGHFWHSDISISPLKLQLHILVSSKPRVMLKHTNMHKNRAAKATRLCSLAKHNCRCLWQKVNYDWEHHQLLHLLPLPVNSCFNWSSIAQLCQVTTDPMKTKISDFCLRLFRGLQQLHNQIKYIRSLKKLII